MKFAWEKSDDKASLCYVLTLRRDHCHWDLTNRQSALRPPGSVGPRPLEKQTQTGVTRDYLEAWRSMSDAFEQNRADLLDRDFIGTAKEKLADTIREQARAGNSYHAIETVRTIFNWCSTHRRAFRFNW